MFTLPLRAQGSDGTYTGRSTPPTQPPRDDIIAPREAETDTHTTRTCEEV